MTEITDPAVLVGGEAPTAPPLSQVERVIDTFVAPSKTFTDILRNQSWWLPFLLSVIFSYGYLFAMQSQIGWDTVAENTLKQDPKAADRLASQSPEQRAQTLSITLAFIKYTFYASPILALAFAAVVALVLWGTINFVFGGRATFGSVFAVWMYGTLPVLITTILTVVTLFVGADKDSFNLSNPVGTNIGFYLAKESPKWLTTLAGAVDIFWLWALFLVGMGLAIVGKVKRSSGLTAIFGWWILILLVRVAIAAFTG
jgi:hypothetical protein